MSREIRSRRAGLSRAESRTRPLYARLLGLQYLRPGGVLCFVYFEGSIALAVLLGLAELVSWWAVLVLPVAVAVMVKLNDVVAGSVAGPPTRTPVAGGRPSTAGGQPSTSGRQRSTASGAKLTAGLPNAGPDTTVAWSAGQDPTAPAAPSLIGSSPAGSQVAGSGATSPTAVPAQARPGAVDTVETAPVDLASRLRTGPRAQPAWWQTVQPAATAPPVEPWYPDAGPQLTTGSAVQTAPPAHGQADGRPAGDPGDPFDPREQRARQSGSRRYG